ncbi:helicase [Opitutaceae bacterium EW11]|nr:helicase [Opitutaceae bacterium EW11]
MATVTEQIKNASYAICQNIASLAGQRSLLSQNLLSQLRNLVEGVAVRIKAGSPDIEFTYAAVEPALAFVRGDASFNFLGKFHKLLQASCSHYTLDGDASERLMLKYFEYLHRTRSLLRDKCGVVILENLEQFPVNLDPSLREYHEKIAEKIESSKQPSTQDTIRDRYYIHSCRPFFARGRIYYEVTFYRAVNKISKFDRLIGFSRIAVQDNYASNLTITSDSIKILDQEMPILIIRDWEVSIRPCELQNFARLLGMSVNIRSKADDYRHIMRRLTTSGSSLLDIVDLPERDYQAMKAAFTSQGTDQQVFAVLDRVRNITCGSMPGSNVLRYLLSRMRNQIIKSQYSRVVCDRLSGLNLPYGCIPFDQMPFCTSLPGHNPPYSDLINSIPIAGREHELLARRVHTNVENHRMLYTPVEGLGPIEQIEALIATYNATLYYKHSGRQLLIDKGHVFVRQYEDEAVEIIEKLQSCAASGIAGYSQAVERWLSEANRGIDDPQKESALKQLFTNSRVALIYGAAGTGKSTMVDHIARYFHDKSKLFLAHTHPAIDNIRRKVTAQNSDYRTISSHLRKAGTEAAVDLLVIDECSTVSNADLLGVLQNTSFKLLVLVGDVFQIESIQFGNWFEIIRSFIPATSVFELTTPFRAKNQALLDFWGKVRAIDDDIAEAMARNGLSSMLDRSLFQPVCKDETVLCLNYSGLYGINNINRFLQSSNPGAETSWGVSVYKIGDPVLFHETERFKPVIYNNLKGWITAIERVPGCIRFDVKLDRSISEFDVEGLELEWLGDSTVRFSIFEMAGTDDDDDSVQTIVPFQVAYAVSIHKAQGLEYDSVKVVITDRNEDDITHSIFYTAITRARERLRVFWTPESQQAVLDNLRRDKSRKDVALLASRRGVKPFKR